MNQKEICKINAAAPTLFKHTDDCHSLFNIKHIDTGLKIRVRVYGIDIGIKLLD